MTLFSHVELRIACGWVKIMANDQWWHCFQLTTVCKFSSLYTLKSKAFVVVLAKTVVSGASQPYD